MKAKSISIGTDRVRQVGDTRDRWVDGHSAIFGLSVININRAEIGAVNYELVWRHTCDQCGFKEERQSMTWSGNYLIEWEE